MKNGFTTGMVLGGVIGAAIGMATSDKNTNGSRKRVMRRGRTMLRRAGSMMSNMADFMS